MNKDEEKRQCATESKKQPSERENKKEKNQDEKAGKSVCFADTKGQQLVDIKNYLPSSESLYRFESSDNFYPPIQATNIIEIEYFEVKWITYFNNHDNCNKNFIDDLKTRRVILESLKIIDSESEKVQYLTGFVRVMNIAYQKEVFLRASYNKWISYFEINCNFEIHCQETDTDLFSFKFPLKNSISKANSVLEFAIAYIVNKDTYWDNNNDNNYRIYQIL